MEKLKPIAFSLMGVMIIVLIIGSVVEQFYGTAVAINYIYTAPWTITLWTITVIVAALYMSSVRMWQQLFTCLLHFSFIIILAGAFITHLWGQQGEIHLRLNEPNHNSTLELPFDIALTDFHLDYYPGTQAPMDYVSELKITDSDKQIEGKVSMNNIFSYRHYRFYQARYDVDGLGTTLQISHDPWGIGVTYLGYALLLLSIIAFFFQKRTHFRQLLQKLALAGVLLVLPIAANATPKTVDKATAEQFGKLYVYYNNRVCPMKTLANDFTTKLYGKSTYNGYSAEQVVCGWLFYYDQWANEPMIKIKGKTTQQLLGAKGKYVCLNDYVGKGKYKLEEQLQEGDKNAKSADEKFRLISMLSTGSMMKIYPISTPSKPLQWYSFSDKMPSDINYQDWQYVVGSMDYVALCVAKNDYKEATASLTKIKTFQEQKAGERNLPSNTRYSAEYIYDSLPYTRPLAMLCATIGILLFIFSCITMSKGKQMNRVFQIVLTILMLCIFVFLTFAFSLRWISSGHVPLSNGFETMQFLAWISALLTSVASLKNIFKPSKNSAVEQLFLPFGYLICGMTLMVSMMSAANPQITLLMPVLQSPLLSLHVSIIMIAYCLLFFIMLNGLMGLILIKNEQQTKRLQIVSQVLLYPAVFCLAIGIFIGAVWANISWGRYWGWDPKEVWALITLLVYSFALHTRSLRFMQKPAVFHSFSIIAFFFVLFTYFGVNFILGGMHSYA